MPDTDGGATRASFIDGRPIAQVKASHVKASHGITKLRAENGRNAIVVPVDVEVFPTAARIAPGHRLRLAIQAYDTPHLVPTLADLAGGLLRALDERGVIGDHAAVGDHLHQVLGHAQEALALGRGLAHLGAHLLHGLLDVPHLLVHAARDVVALDRGRGDGHHAVLHVIQRLVKRAGLAKLG